MNTRVGPLSAAAIGAYALPMGIDVTSLPGSVSSRASSPWAHIQGRVSRYPQAVAYRGDVAPELAGLKVDPRKLMAGAHHLGNADEE